MSFLFALATDTVLTSQRSFSGMESSTTEGAVSDAAPHKDLRCFYGEDLGNEVNSSPLWPAQMCLRKAILQKNTTSKSFLIIHSKSTYDTYVQWA